MSRRGNREDWMRAVKAGQRNIVFPDTTANEARFWRNIISGKQRLSVPQIVGIGLVCAAVAFPLWSLLEWMRKSILAWLSLGLCFAAFLLLRWRVWKALSNSDEIRRKRT
jgi:hypothetical protein